MTTAHNIVPASGPAFALPSGGGGPTGMTKPWPEWAMLRAEEVREKLPPEQWGPWTNGGQCVVSNTITGSSNQMAPHPTEEPYFFHCKAHLQAIRERNPTVRPWPPRDRGRCTSCGAPAARRPVTMADPVACVQAERTNSTVARLSAKRHCDRCNPNRRRLCRGRMCQRATGKHWVQSAGCCNITKTSQRRHCAKCCAAAAANLSAQVMPPTTIAAGTAARRKSSDERSERILGLHCEGLDNRAIAHGLGVSVRTVQRALKAAKDLATDRT